MAMNHWYQSMYQMFELVSDFIEAWLCYGFVGLFLPDRVRGKVLFFILSLVLVGSVRAMDILGIDPMISTLWFVFYICMTTVVLFQVNLFYAVSLVSFYILCLYVINYFCMSVMGVIAGNRQFAQFILNQLSLLRCIYLAADTALLFLLYMLIRRAFKGGLLYSPRMLFTISLLGILGITFLSVVTLQDISVITLFSWSLCLVMVLCFIFGAAFMLTILMLGILRKRIISPIYVLLESAEKIEQGNLEEEIPYVSRDEFGELADSFRQMQASLKDVIMDVKTNLERMGGNDFCVKIHANYRGEFEMIRESLVAISDHLSMTLSRINESADQVADSSEQVSAGAQMLSQGATEQASSVEELAATINELSGHVTRNADNAAKATLTAEEVKGYALESGRRMSEMLDAITNISDRSKEIGKIIKTIEDIAFQTNILALNAAVEAARAGEAGKGFAVVADEVRSLAGKSAEASNNSAEMIKESLKAVEQGTLIADETAKSLNNVVNGVQGITQAIEDISSSSEEQAASLSQVTIGIDQISSVVQTTSATAEESAASSEELSDQARKLKELVGRFRLKEGCNSGI